MAENTCETVFRIPITVKHYSQNPERTIIVWPANDCLRGGRDRELETYRRINEMGFCVLSIPYFNHDSYTAALEAGFRNDRLQLRLNDGQSPLNTRPTSWPPHKCLTPEILSKIGYSHIDPNPDKWKEWPEINEILEALKMEGLLGVNGCEYQELLNSAIISWSNNKQELHKQITGKVSDTPFHSVYIDEPATEGYQIEEVRAFRETVTGMKPPAGESGLLTANSFDIGFYFRTGVGEFVRRYIEGNELSEWIGVSDTAFYTDYSSPAIGDLWFNQGWDQRSELDLATLHYGRGKVTPWINLASDFHSGWGIGGVRITNDWNEVGRLLGWANSNGMKTVGVFPGEEASCGEFFQRLEEFRKRAVEMGWMHISFEERPPIIQHMYCWKPKCGCNTKDINDEWSVDPPPWYKVAKRQIETSQAEGDAWNPFILKFHF